MQSRQIIQNPARAEAVIAFVERLKITEGPAAGQRITLDDWQKDFVRDIYSPTYEDDLRVVRRAVLSVARKNAKSLLTAGLLLAHLIGPEAEPNGQIFTAANDREQASIIFHMIKRMVEAEPALQRFLKVVPSTKTIYVTRSDITARGSVYRALSAEAGTKHGLNPSFIAYDELAQAKSRELLDTLLTSQGARAEPLFVVISTQSHDPQHPLSEMIDDGVKGEDPTIVCHLYAADEGCDLLDQAQWFKANPTLRSWRKLDEVETFAKRAARLPSEEQSFRNLYLNQRISMVSSLIAQADWKACAGAELVPGEAIYLGLDMSLTTDLCALVAVSAEDGSRVGSWFWKPGDTLLDHEAKDRVPYSVWKRDGHLETTSGRTVNPQAIATKIAELTSEFDVIAMAYDRWRIDTLLREFDRIGFEAQEGPGAGLRIEAFGQGFKDMAPAIDAFENAVLTGELRHDGNPVLTNCVMNATATTDPAGNRKLVKDRARFRIDGAVALTMALGQKAKERADNGGHSVWESDEYRMPRF